MNNYIRLVILISFLASNSNADFFDERYRGWFWFEQNLEKSRHKKTPMNHVEAKQQIENLRNELENRKNIMIAEPNAENVINYIILEEKMWENALALDAAFREAKFLHPDYFDKFKNPTNSYAVKLKRRELSKVREEKIRNFAHKYDLVFFSKENCPYSNSFAPILKDFSQNYKFKTEEISFDGKISGLFSGRNLPDLAEKLGIKIAPTIVAVAKNERKAFEMIRGYVTKSELEEYAELASNYVGN